MPAPIQCDEAAEGNDTCCPQRPIEKGTSGMQTIQEVNAEQLAKLFHHYHEALQHDCDSREDSSQHDSCNQDSVHEDSLSAWDRTPQSERKLMIAAAKLALLELSTTPEAPRPRRKYYAQPGEADWGC